MQRYLIILALILFPSIVFGHPPVPAPNFPDFEVTSCTTCTVTNLSGAGDPTNIVSSDAAKDIAIGLSSNSAFIVGDKTPIGFWDGDGVSSGTATITDVGGAAHGLSLAAGDLVHVQNSTTAADEGIYRIDTVSATNVGLDRALSGSDTDLTVRFYKDVIAVQATDGTNGQLIQSYSHQDKPLQIGGDTLAATGHSLGAEDVLLGGLLEVDGNSFFDATLNVSGGKVAFPATQSASADANTLDDYEEGDWTVTFTPSTSGSITLSWATGAYTKIGRQVTVTSTILVDSVSSPVGFITLGGLPFTVGNNVKFQGGIAVMGVGLNAGVITSITGRTDTNTTNIQLNRFEAGTIVALAGLIEASDVFYLTAVYFTD